MAASASPQSPMQAGTPNEGANARSAAVSSTPAGSARRSGFDFMRPSTQALQRDDLQNPALLWVADGADLWRARAGSAEKSCGDCHGDAAQSMRGVAARYPRFDDTLNAPALLSTRINLCRTRQQRAPAWPAESQPLLAIEAYVAHQSRGLPIAPDDDPRLAPHAQRGEALYRQRIGQLDFSCAMCHDGAAGRRLGGSPIPQGHPTGYPIYRLEWQALGSLERRLRNCLTGVRAEPYPFGALEHAQLTLYLMRRAAGMAIETPAVRP
jgi:sulfur-oxidizing protein SoxA